MPASPSGRAVPDLSTLRLQSRYLNARPSIDSAPDIVSLVKQFPYPSDTDIDLGAGIFGTSDTGYGGVFQSGMNPLSGTVAQIRLVPAVPLKAPLPMPGHAGDLFVRSTGDQTELHFHTGKTGWKQVALLNVP